eukprot:453360-Pelagomonas_calceolata.AAC.7
MEPMRGSMLIISGHERAVLYPALCEVIWTGCPASCSAPAPMDDVQISRPERVSLFPAAPQLARTCCPTPVMVFCY